MTWTAMTGEVSTQPGVKAYDMNASGTIYLGQGVAISPSMEEYVFVPQSEGILDSGQRLFGIAAYGETNGQPIAIYGPYNICKCRISGEGAVVAVGTPVGLGYEGYLTPLCKYPSAYVLEAPTANLGIGKVLIQ